MEFVGRDLFTLPLQPTLRQFEEADNFGSLIRPEITDVGETLKILESKNFSGHIFLGPTHDKVLQVLHQADYLSPKYHVVIANPPYMGGKGMNGPLGTWAKENYPKSKSDLFAMFIERNLDLVLKQGVVAMITMQSWMFLSSFEKLRTQLLEQNTLLSMAHLGARAFDSISGEVVSTTAYVLENAINLNYQGSYLRLVDGKFEAEKYNALRKAVKNPHCGWLYHATALDFKKIPGSPIAYWLSDSMRDTFSAHRSLAEVARPKEGLNTTNNDRFLRRWWECSFREEKIDSKSAMDAISSGVKWFPCQKGGSYRKWYGNNEYVVNWYNNGQEIKATVVKQYGSVTKRVVNEPLYFKEGIAWSAVSSSSFAMRHVPPGHIFETAGSMCFFNTDREKLQGLGFCNTCIVKPLLQCLSPTLSFKPGPVGSLPMASKVPEVSIEISKSAILYSKEDWDSFETSWDFTSLPLLNPDYHLVSLEATYKKLRAYWQETTLEMQRLEKENNRIFIDAYGLQEELTPEVLLKEITLTCNPHYRYNGDKSEEELEVLLLADTMRELISYAVGCMFGRYALEKPGLILANQGETIEDYLKQVSEPSFPADDNNVIPMLDGDWFTDDIVGRFREFLRVAFGEEHYEVNLKFVEKALGKNGKARDIHDYFLKDFYSDHVKRYKKRPIYWLFSSPKGSFNVLIYMHRYRPDTVSVVLNDYLREFRIKLFAEKNQQEAMSISASASQGEKTKALKQIEKVNKMIAEMEAYEREVLYPLATNQVEIDLDDGVKVNYPKLGAALRKIPGLDANKD